MAISTDDDDVDDGEAMWAPHRRPTFPVDAPALVRHVMIRMPVELSPYLNKPGRDPSNKFDKARNDLIEALNAFLDKLQGPGAPYRPRFCVSRRDTSLRDPVEITDTLFFRLMLKGSMRLGVRIDVHNEYLTITYLADVLKIDQLDTASGRVGNILHQLSGADCKDEDTATRHVEYLYDRFWDDVEAEAKAPFVPLGTRVADFRGFILTVPEIDKSTAPIEDIPSDSVARIEQAPRHKKLELRSSRLEDRRDKKIDYDVFHFVKRRPEFFGTLLGFRKDLSEMNSAANVPISGVLDGAAIYSSTLRAQSRDGFTPLRYFIVYNGNSRHQLGRLIRRLNVLGELRIAAMMDTRALMIANRRIRELNFDIDEVRPREMTMEKVRGFYDRLTSADKGDGKFTDTKGQERSDVKCHGGAIYRVQRSQYYAQSYIDRIQDLRIVRIEGWQPYDAFMRRNLFMEFDYIRQIGERFANVARRLDREAAILQFMALSRSTDTAAKQITVLNKSNDEIANFTRQMAMQTAALIALSERSSEDVKALKALAANVAEQTVALNVASIQAKEDVTALRQLASNISTAQEDLVSLQAVAEPVGVGAFAYYVGASLSKLIPPDTVGPAADATHAGIGHDLLEFACIVGAGLLYWFVVRRFVLKILRRENDRRKAELEARSNRTG